MNLERFLIAIIYRVICLLFNLMELLCQGESDSLIET